MRKPLRPALVGIFAVLVLAAVFAVVVGSGPPPTQSTNGQTTVTSVSPGTTRPGQVESTSSGPTTTSESGIIATTQPGSSTTTVPEPTTTGPPLSVGIIGYIGCSNTADTVRGYFKLGGSNFWPNDSSYSGGTAVNWVEKLTYWQTFDAQLSARPTSTFWWQLCARANETETETYNASLSILATLASKVPGATVYLSPLNGWLDPHICAQVGPEGEQEIDAVVARLLDEGRALTGPVIPDLQGEDSVGDGVVETRRDGCHPNSVGEAKLGASLLGFFG